MRVIAYIPLHYGAEYLWEAIMSVDNFVEKIVVIYSENPSFGFGTNIKCPENEEQLKKIAHSASNKITWVKGNFTHEGQHRAFIENFSKGYDLTLALDADEVWNEEDLKRCLDKAMVSSHRYHGINGFKNFWKSFNHVCLDGFHPIRITKNAIKEHNSTYLDGTIYHFSCAQSLDIIKYKWEVHGHKSELRTDWFEKYLKWTPEDQLPDLHPVAIGLWNAVEFDKETLPEILKKHPNFNKNVIY